MEKQKSFRVGLLEKQQSFREKKNKGITQKRGDSPLHLASRAGNLLQVREILLGGAHSSHLNALISAQNNDGETPLYVAAENGHVEVVHEILQQSDAHSASLKAKNGLDAFHIAAKQGHVDVLKELRSSFPELAMTVGPSNATALDTAAFQGHVDVVNLLLETDASLAKITRNKGKTALHVAARMGHVEVVRSLLAKDAGIAFRTDKKGQAGIHVAVKGPSLEVIAELLKLDSSIISLEDNKGNTPLHIATSKGRALMVQRLLGVEGVNVNAFNRAGETAFDISQKSCAGNGEIPELLRTAGGVAAAEHENPPSPAKQLKRTVSDIKHDVQSQLQQTQKTGFHVQRIKKRLKKLHIGGLNNAINSNTVVAVLIATIAFAAIFTGYSLGEAYIATNAAFVIFFVSDSLALFISLAVVVVQTSIVVIEQKAKRQMVFVINKLMWLACLFIFVAFVSLTYIVVGRRNWWLTVATTVVGAIIMLTTLGSMCYCIITHRLEQKNMRNLRRNSMSQSHSLSAHVDSDSDILNSIYAL
ncbi:unnamed protein product [Spirodela intermedia]|uniref:PGG domain-containing protein n=1 Tax=Spirodela intermedia TaxID=51605 RepID=A0A7I8J166_SPIIN|nr:unnamed protein product [Spirodela intermedia]CAA6663888.1 unnamed protein product [Spirodela intermedia]